MTARRTILVLSGVVALVLLVFAVLRTMYWSYGADTGTMAIAIQNLPNGMFDQFEHSSHYRFHWSPILATLYPLLAVTHSILALQIAQIILVIGTVVVFYFLLERYMDARLALRCTIVALFYPPLIALSFSEFHELAFAPVLTMLALLALSARTWLWYGVSLALLLCVKEDVAIICAVCGVVLGIVGRLRSDRPLIVAGTLTAVSSACVLLVYFAIIVPLVGGWMPAHFYTYPWNRGVLAVAAQIFNWGRVTYVLEIFVPLVFLPMMTRWFWLILPGLAVVLLANSADVWRMGMHYVALWLPWVLIALAAGLARIRERSGERVALRWANAATALCVVFLAAVNPMHVGHYMRPSYHDLAAVKRAIACVPPDVIVGTHDQWYTAMAFTHRNATIGAPSYARYLLFADDFPNAEFQATILPVVRDEVASGRAKEICRVDRVAVYKRIQS